MSVTRNAAGFMLSAIKYFAVFILALGLPFAITDSWLLQSVLLLAGLYAASLYGKWEFGRS